MNDAENNAPRVRHDKVVRGTVRTKQKGTKFSDVFLAEDVNNVKSFLLLDVLIPATKKLIMDLVTNGLGMLLDGSTSRRSGSTNAPYVSYRDYGDRYRDDTRRVSDSSRSSIRHSYNDVIFETRGDAEEVLRCMREALREYGTVSIFDLYDFAGLPSSVSDRKYGWVSLRDVDVYRANGGYVLSLPRALPID